MPTLARIFVHPIKSLSRVRVQEARILEGGSLAHDREFALFDRDGDVVNAKRYPRVHSIQANYDLERYTVALSRQEAANSETFHLLDDQAKLEAWFSEFFGLALTLKRNETVGFPDDLEAWGPTLVSVATLEEVNAWFPALDREQVARRFRANLEISETPAFWEDRLFGEPGEVVHFTIDAVQFHGVNPCARCPVPSRHPDTGEVLTDFQKIFSTRRQETLPDWASLSRFNHFYRLTVNTRLPKSEAGKTLRVGDSVKL